MMTVNIGDVKWFFVTVIVIGIFSGISGNDITTESVLSSTSESKPEPSQTTAIHPGG